MDFFGRQQEAHRKTRRLVFLFAVAVGSIIAAVYFVALVTLNLTSESEGGVFDGGGLWYPEVFAFVAIGVLALVGLGCLYKVAQLRGGGSAVATLMGGRPIAANTTDQLERRFVNVVEEIAIASGVPVPALFVMENESSINAFAAGYQPSTAAIAVTRGCLEQLDRDELQGVIAHEFSHVFNGDMRLNIRLMGVLFGITCLAMAGYVILRGGIYGSIGGSRRNKGGGAAAILGMGLGLIVIGYIGVFFARMIKAAVSRQREFLADASAVQFTRNPMGIGGALKKIGGFTNGSRIRSAHAEEASHMFFSNGMNVWMRLLATHPPIDARIRRLEPAFRALPAAERAGTADLGPAMGFAGASTPDRMVAQIGSPQQAHVSYSASLIASLPMAVGAAAHDPFSGRCVIFGLLMEDDREIRRRQMDLLTEHTDAATAHETHVLAQSMADLPLHARLPLVELTIPALREMSPQQFLQFQKVVELLVEADEKVTVFEFALQKLLLRHLHDHFDRRPPTRVRYGKLDALMPYCTLVISSLARAGHEDEKDMRQAFREGMTALDGSAGTEILAEDACSLRLLDQALDRLVRATPFIKRQVLIACARAVSSDGEVQTREAELLRAIADTLDCPMPPVVA
jgi:Zn-dependent protease with chaperone function